MKSHFIIHQGGKIVGKSCRRTGQCFTGIFLRRVAFYNLSLINQDQEKFNIGAKKVPCRIRIEAIDGFTYTYKLFVKEKGIVLRI